MTATLPYIPVEKLSALLSAEAVLSSTQCASSNYIVHILCA